MVDMAVQDKACQEHESEVKHLYAELSGVREKNRADADIEIGDASYSSLGQIATVKEGLL